MKRLIALMMCAVSLSLFAQETGCTTSGACYSNTFTYTGTAQTYIVPAGISSITIETWGAQGGSGGGGDSQGGYGGYATGILSVFSGQTLHVYVGGEGGVPSPGWNGGGNGTIGSWWSGAGGGGASDVRINTGSLTDRVIVAAGGGGGGHGTGGVGGGLIGGQGSSGGTTVWAHGGTQSSGGTGGLYNNNSCAPGSLASDGILGIGGNGINGSNSCLGGGFGGGGGYYGGGGSQISSAGGGSSYIGGVTDAITNSGVRAGDGLVVICAYISEGACDCSGNVLDECGICGGENSCLGCTEEAACNYNVEATQDDDSCTYDCYGCTTQSACNFSPIAIEDDGSCDYSCCPGPGCCLDGQHWDWELNGCVITNPSDSNFDGCVQLNDLLDLLSAYGDCGAEESTWQCGDPLEYQGYDYETVQIEEQCWFAENLRAENYRDGDAILADLNDDDWVSTTTGAVAVYGEGGNDCASGYSGFDACNDVWALAQYGRLYNWWAVGDTRALCPVGWHVPTAEEFGVFGIPFILGGIEWDASSLKSEQGWYFETSNGTNATGFNAMAAGLRTNSFGDSGISGSFWSSTFGDGEPWRMNINHSLSEVEFGQAGSTLYGFSIRCIKDAE